MNNLQLIHLRNFYYSKTFILLEIVKIARHRELSFLGSEKNKIRHINAGMLEILQKNMKEFKFIERDFNIYYSLAHLKDNWGVFSYNPMQRKEQSAVFNRNFDDYFTGYDFSIDFDGNKRFNHSLAIYKNEIVEIVKKQYNNKIIEAFEIDYKGKMLKIKANEVGELSKEVILLRAYNDLIFLKKIYDKHKVSYWVTFSGNRGFHLCVDDECLPDVKPDDKVKICNKLAVEFQQILNLGTIDTSIYDKRRPWKMPYSLVNGNVCLSLSDEQINNFNIEDMKALNVLKSIKIMNRGLLKRNDELSLEHKKENFNDLLREFN